MRILALTNLYPSPSRPKRAPFNRQQFDALTAHHDVQVIAPIAWTDECAARRRHGGASLPPERRSVNGDVTTHYPRYVFTPRVLRGCYGEFMVHSVRRCFRDVVESFRPDVVLGCWAYPDGWAAVQLAREAGVPVAIKVHGSDVLTIADQPARRRRTRAALNSADAVIAVSKDLADGVLALGVDPARVHVVRNGVDHAMFHPGPRDAARDRLGVTSSGPLILFVGNLVPVKGLDILLDALARLARDGGRGGGELAFQCILVGEGPLKAELTSRVAGLGLAGRVQLVGARPLEELPQWYRAADLVVLPSRSEGIPNVLLEAAACGTPFIASRVGGIPEIAAPGCLIPPGDAPALAERIRAFLVAGEGELHSSTYLPSSWDDSAQALATVLHGIVPARHIHVPAAA